MTERPFKRVGILVKPDQRGSTALVERIAAVASEAGAELTLESDGPIEVGSIARAPREDVLAGSDLIVALGGDGTMLGVARDLGARDVPILGVNLGHLGFLTAVHPQDAESVLANTLAGAYELDERARLEVLLLASGGDSRREFVLNDAVFTKGSALARMIELEVHADEQLIARYRSDGLIVATPTGSTAYNLSAGGPLLDPSLSAMVLNPICPHTLTQRPLVLPDRISVEVRLLSDEEITLTLDGQVGLPLQPGNRIRITRAAHSVRLVAPAGASHFETLREKLRWGAN